MGEGWRHASGSSCRRRPSRSSASGTVGGVVGGRVGGRVGVGGDIGIGREVDVGVGVMTAVIGGDVDGGSYDDVRGIGGGKVEAVCSDGRGEVNSSDGGSGDRRRGKGWLFLDCLNNSFDH